MPLLSKHAFILYYLLIYFLFLIPSHAPILLSILLLRLFLPIVLYVIFLFFFVIFFFFTFCFYDVYTVPHYSYDHPFQLWKQLLYFDMDKLIYIVIQPFLRHFPLVCCILLNITLHFTVKLFKHLTLNDTVTQHGHAFDALHA